MIIIIVHMNLSIFKWLKFKFVNKSFFYSLQSFYRPHLRKEYEIKNRHWRNRYRHQQISANVFDHNEVKASRPCLRLINENAEPRLVIKPTDGLF